MGEAKRSQIWCQMECVVHSSFTARIGKKNEREMNEPFVSVQKYIRRENVCEERDTFAPLSLREAGFPRARERPKASAGKEKSA